MTTEPSASPLATPDDVAALLTARTKDAQGRELGRWTEQTRPTTEQVQSKIEIARTLVSGGLPVPEVCAEAAESTVALLAAMLVEAAFFPEQTQGNQTTYERLRELYFQARDGLALCVAGSAGGGGAFELDVSGWGPVPWPPDWWQRDLENRKALEDAIAMMRGGHP